MIVEKSGKKTTFKCGKKNPGKKSGNTSVKIEDRKGVDDGSKK